MGVHPGLKETVDDLIFRDSSLTTDHLVDEAWFVTAVVKGLLPRLKAVVIQADPKTLEGVRQEASKAELAAQLTAEAEDHFQTHNHLAMLNALSELTTNMQALQESVNAVRIENPNRNHRLVALMVSTTTLTRLQIVVCDRLKAYFSHLTRHI